MRSPPSSRGARAIFSNYNNEAASLPRRTPSAFFACIQQPARGSLNGRQPNVCGDMQSATLSLARSVKLFLGVIRAFVPRTSLASDPPPSLRAAERFLQIGISCALISHGARDAPTRVQFGSGPAQVFCELQQPGGPSRKSGRRWTNLGARVCEDPGPANRPVSRGSHGPRKPEKPHGPHRPHWSHKPHGTYTSHKPHGSHKSHKPHGPPTYPTSPADRGVRGSGAQARAARHPWRARLGACDALDRPKLKGLAELGIDEAVRSARARPR